MVLRIIATTLFIGILLTPFAHAEEQYELKFATLIPADTAWMKEIDAWAENVHKKSGGRLKFKIYAGGVMGDEPDVLRKIRVDQLQGAFFTGYGIGRIFSPARVLEVPFLFRNTAESDYVRKHLMDDIKQGFQDSGFQLLGWPEVGFIHFFSKKPIRSLEELKQRNIWLWQGDPLGEAFAQAADISPIPLSIIDVYGQLSATHGSIDTVYNSPFGALALQWHTKLNYATHVPMTNAIGSLVVSTQFFRQLPDDLQQLLKKTGWKTGQAINTIARRDNRESIELLKKSGIEFMWKWNDQEQAALLSIRDRAARQLVEQNYIPEDYFQRSKQLLNRFRAREDSGYAKQAE